MSHSEKEKTQSRKPLDLEVRSETPAEYHCGDQDPKLSSEKAEELRLLGIKLLKEGKHKKSRNSFRYTGPRPLEHP